MRYDKSYEKFSRKIYSILEWFESIGGFKETIKMICEISVYLLVEKLFFAKIMKNIYHVRKYKDDPTFFNSEEYKERMEQKKRGCRKKKKSPNVAKVQNASSYDLA